MKIPVEKYEKLGAFYLGREYDAEERELKEDLLLYDSKDLVTHGVVLGMTGSGKTGLCLAMLEEAAMDGVPALVIDPKGDIANLMLTFPELRGEDFRPWINESDAERAGVTADEFACSQAGMWKDGLAEWGQGPERIRALRERVDITIFTPGSTAGVPVSILGSLSAPSPELVDDRELFGDRIESTVSSLLALMGIEADPIRSREHILMSTIFDHHWRAGEDLDLASLVGEIQNPPFSQVGVMDVESFYPEKKRVELAMAINNLLAAPGFASWLEGEPMEVGGLLHTPGGKPRISIFSIAHLSDSERMFFVSLLLNETLAWMRSQAGTTSLRALLYMDEIYGYLPPTQNPPSKKPMMTMLKQARAFGLGVLLATQNPVDLDYKALSNMGTWFLGRLQTERDVNRVLDGLEGAASAQGGGRMDRRAMARMLAGLGKRLFLLNNVHEDGPVVFQVRWVMSYLRGPLTRGQIRKLMAERKKALAGTVVEAEEPTAGRTRAGLKKPAATPGSGSGAVASRPSLPRGIDEFFLPAEGGAAGETEGANGERVWAPAVLRAGEAFVSDAKKGVRGTRRVAFINRLRADDTGVDWEQREELEAGVQGLARDEPGGGEEGGQWEPLPAFAVKKSGYTAMKKELVDWIYRKGGIEVWSSPTLKMYSKAEETEAAFRVRLRQAAREERDRRVEVMRERYGKKVVKIEDRVERAMAALEREREQASSAKMDTAVSFGSTILGVLFGRKKMSMGTISRGRSTANRASRAWKQSRDVGRAEEKVEGLREDMEKIEAECEREIDSLRDDLDPDGEVLEKVMVRPYKKDITVKALGIVWIEV